VLHETFSPPPLELQRDLHAQTAESLREGATTVIVALLKDASSPSIVRGRG
jgi:predicted transcriptional regulator